MQMRHCWAVVFGLAIWIGVRGVQAAPANDDEVTKTMKSLESAEAQVRADGAAHLRELGSEAQVAVPSLIKLLGDQTPTRESGDRSAMAPHGRIFPSPGFEAAQTLALMGGAALEPLAEAAKSPDAATRERAIWALRNWRDPRGAALARAMKDQDAEIRALAAGGMGPGMGVNPLGVLLEATKDKDAQVRQAAVGSLGNIPQSPRAADAIIAVMKNDPDDEVRSTAATALGNSGDARAAGLLVAALSGADQPVRNTAVQMLGIMRDGRAVVPLVGLLADKAPVMRMLAATSLGQIKDEGAIAALMKAIDDEDARVRNCAMDALGKITGQEFGVEEGKWKKWWEGKERK